jgi:hypothetical protein
VQGMPYAGDQAMASTEAVAARAERKRRIEEHLARIREG